MQEAIDNFIHQLVLAETQSVSQNDEKSERKGEIMNTLRDW